MLVGIEAKFSKINEAKKAFSIIESSVEVDVLEVLTVDKIEKYKSPSNAQNITFKLLIGILVGLGSAFTLHKLIKINALVDNFNDEFLIPFLVGGSIAGLLCATLIHFIAKESKPPISLNDIENHEALVVIKVSKDKLDNVLSLLKDTNVDSIHTT